MSDHEKKYGKEIKIKTQADFENAKKLQQQDPTKPIVTNVNCYFLLSNTFVTDETLAKMVDAFPFLLAFNLDGRKKITDSGCQVLSKLTSLRMLDLGSTKITDAAMPHIAKLTSLQKLTLRDTDIGDAAMPHIAKLTSLRVLVLDYTQITDAAMQHLAKLTSLQELNLSGTQITDAGMPHMSQLTSLQVLHLSSIKITDAAIPHISQLTSLQLLNLSYTQITDAVLPHIAKLTSLQRLYLSNTQISDAAMLHIAKLTSLRALNLSNTKFSDAGTPHIAQLTSLQALDLDSTKITDASMPHIAQLTSLQELSLSYTQITDASMPHVAKLTSLQVLNLHDTHITDAGLLLLVNLPYLNPEQVYTSFNKVTKEGYQSFKKLLLENQAKQKSQQIVDFSPILEQINTENNSSLTLADLSNEMKQAFTMVLSLLKKKDSSADVLKLYKECSWLLALIASHKFDNINEADMQILFDNNFTLKKFLNLDAKQMEDLKLSQTAQVVFTNVIRDEKMKLEQQAKEADEKVVKDNQQILITTATPVTTTHSSPTIITIPQNDQPTNTDLSNNISTGNAAVIKTVKQESSSVKDEITKLTAAFESLLKNDKYSGAFYKGDPSSVTILEDQILGTGCFSTVYLASMSGQKVAAKRLNADPRRDVQQQADATAREAMMLMNSKDPNVVQCFGVLVQKPYTYILLEKCECNLSDFVSILDKELTLAHRVYLASSVARAISLLHAQQIIFADLKPQNVLISGTGECKLSDFGSAASTSSTTATSLLASGVTAAYAAVELRNSQPTFASDVYALGVVCCEIVTGEPFHPIDSLDIDNFGGNDNLLNLIRRCMAKDASKRPKAATVADTLRNEILPVIDKDFAEDPQDELMSAVMSFRKKMKKIGSPVKP